MGIITLLTDFGQRDVYVGVMKGVIVGIAPQVRLIDLTHDIPPQNLALASFQLQNAVAHFPPDTVHLVVVDPGVGSQRRGIALQLASGFLVGPDNGVFTGVLCQTPVLAAVELNQPLYWYTPTPSRTFHGRDIFAPVAAHLARGVPLLQVGSPLDPASLVRLPAPTYTTTANGKEFVGRIQAIDHFGNLISTIPAAVVTGTSWSVEMANQRIPAVNSYSDRPVGAIMALIGSHGWIEVAVNGGRAEVMLNCQVDDALQVVLNSP